MYKCLPANAANQSSNEGIPGEGLKIIASNPDFAKGVRPRPYDSWPAINSYGRRGPALLRVCYPCNRIALGGGSSGFTSAAKG